MKMYIVAQSKAGAEYLYKVATAHKVSKAGGEQIAAILNANNWKLKPGFLWFVHEVDSYDTAHEYATGQEFKLYRGSVRRYARFSANF